jgi:hypothetical protein
LRGRKFDEVSEHLRECENCSNELEKLQCVSRVLKEHYESSVGQEDFSTVWAQVDAAVGASGGVSGESFLDRLIRVLWIPRPAWAAVGVAAMAVVLLLAYLPGGPPETLAANDCIIDTVETAHDCSVMVYEVGESNMKVIWIMEQQMLPTEKET